MSRLLVDTGSSKLCMTQDGTDGFDQFHAAVITEDNSVVLAGITSGGWGTTRTQADWYDFAAVKLDDDGKEMWRYQARWRAASWWRICFSNPLPRNILSIASGSRTTVTIRVDLINKLHLAQGGSYNFEVSGRHLTS